MRATGAAFSVLVHAIRAARAALQWRLLLLWSGILLLPTALLALPLWHVLGVSFDHSVHAAALAQELDLSTIADLLANIGRNGASVPSAAWHALIATLLLSPLLSGMAMSAARAAQPQGFGMLIGGAIEQYVRMARMLMLALVPLGLALGLGAVLLAAADQYGSAAQLESDADGARLLALLGGLLLLMLAHASLDAARAALALDRRRRSVVRAWWDGCTLLARRPLATLGLYLAVTAAALMVASPLSLARIHLPPVSAAGFIGAFVLTQLIVMTFAWMRIARLFAMVALARSLRAPETSPLRAAISTN